MQTGKVITPAQYLTEELERRIKKNPSYSLRSFALALKLSPGELSEVLRGKRNLSLKSALKVAKGLALSPGEQNEFLSLLQHAEAERAGITLSKANTPQHKLSDDLFHVISDWYCLAILSLAETRGFRFDSSFISKKLGISLVEVKLALERLERVGMIHLTKGQYQVVDGSVISPDEIPSEAVRKCHVQLLDKAKEALETQEIGEREISGITFAADPKRLPEFKRDLKKFLDAWADKTTQQPTQSKTEVFHLETALFRLTKGDRS